MDVNQSFTEEQRERIKAAAESFRAALEIAAEPPPNTVILGEEGWQIALRVARRERKAENRRKRRKLRRKGWR